MKYYMLTVKRIISAADHITADEIIAESVRRGYIQSLSDPFELAAVIEPETIQSEMVSLGDEKLQDRENF